MFKPNRGWNGEGSIAGALPSLVYLAPTEFAIPQKTSCEMDGIIAASIWFLKLPWTSRGKSFPKSKQNQGCFIRLTPNVKSNKPGLSYIGHWFNHQAFTSRFTKSLPLKECESLSWCLRGASCWLVKMRTQWLNTIWKQSSVYHIVLFKFFPFLFFFFWETTLLPCQLLVTNVS